MKKKTKKQKKKKKNQNKKKKKKKKSSLGGNGQFGLMGNLGQYLICACMYGIYVCMVCLHFKCKEMIILLQNGSDLLKPNSLE